MIQTMLPAGTKPAKKFCLVGLFLLLQYGVVGVAQAIQEETALRIHLISGSAEYQSEHSLKELKQTFHEDFEDVWITASWGEDAGDDLPDIERLAEADLLIVFTRRMTLPEDQLAYIINYIEQEKPVIGLKTASHAFQDFLELDSRVFGGDYDGHGDDEIMTLSIDEEAGGASGYGRCTTLDPSG